MCGIIWQNIVNVKVTIRVTFDDNSFIPSKAVQKGFMPIQYTVIAWEQDRHIQTFAHPEIFYYSAITVVFISRWIALENHFLNSQN